MGLNPEYVFAHRIAFVRQAAHEFCRLVVVQFCEFVMGIARQKIRHQSPFDRGEGAKRLQVSYSSAIAYRFHSAGVDNTLVGKQNMTQFSAEAVFALYDTALKDDAATVARANDGRDRCLPTV